MNRRDLIKSAPSAALFGALPAVALAASETPIMSLYRQWKEIHALLNDEDLGLSDAAWKDLHAETWDICDRIMKLPANGEAEVLVKMMVFTCEGEHGLPGCDAPECPQFWAEVRAVIGGVA